MMKNIACKLSELQPDLYLRELLNNKCISEESYSIFFDLGSAYTDTELTAELPEYKKF